MLKNIDTLLSFPFDHYVGGHPGLVGTYADILEGKAFFLSLVQAAKLQANASDFYQYLPNWHNFNRAFSDANACLCAQQLITQWGGILGGVDVYSFSHCGQIQSDIAIVANPSEVIYSDNEPPCGLSLSSGSFLTPICAFLCSYILLGFFW